MNTQVQGPVALERAIEILTPPPPAPKVLTAEAALALWGGLPAQTAGEVVEKVLIRYGERALAEAAEENRTQATDWRLVWHPGLSLREQCERAGTDRERQPCFDPNHTWWLQPSEDEWATASPPVGYYLIDFNGRWGRTRWNRQQELIAELGPEYERAHESIVSGAVLGNFVATGERLLENWYHWGPSRDSDGNRVFVGSFDRDGLGVDGDGPDWDDDGGLRVCLLRKFQG